MAEELITPELLDALAMVESQNNPQALGDRGLRYPAYGAYQMREPAYRDVVSAYPALGDIPLAQTLGNAERQRALAEAYLRLLNTRYGLTTLDDVIAGYNAGPGTVRRGRLPESTKGYVHRVKSRLGGR